MNTNTFSPVVRARRRRRVSRSRSTLQATARVASRGAGGHRPDRGREPEPVPLPRRRLREGHVDRVPQLVRDAVELLRRFRSITNLTIGNHEYENNAAPGYFDYWDNVPNYGSVPEAGASSPRTRTSTWPPGPPQYTWLENQLQTQSATCTLAYMHHPIFSIGPQGDTTRLSPIWSLLASYGVDVVLTAHDHDYQRWVPLNGAGAPSPLGPHAVRRRNRRSRDEGFVRLTAGSRRHSPPTSARSSCASHSPAPRSTS